MHNVCRQEPCQQKKCSGGCHEFFLMEVETRVVAATLKVLGLDSIDGEPNSTSMPASLVDSSTDTRKKFLKSLSLNVIDKYVSHQEQMAKIIADAKKEKQADVEILPDGKFPCRFPSCKKTFAHDGKRREAHEKTHDLKKAEAITTPTQCSDDMFNYQLALLEYGMLYKNFCDAISEGDGGRLLRCWKYFLMIMKKDGARSRKYPLEGLNLLCQTYAILFPRDAHRLVWNRSVKAKYGAGGNIPLDLALEHYNRVLKEVIKKMGPNACNEKAVSRFCKAIPTNKQLMDNFDHTCKVLRRSGKHVKTVASNDFGKIVEELIQSDAFTQNTQRNLNKFRNCGSSILTNCDLHSMFVRINEHRRSIYLHKTAR